MTIGEIVLKIAVTIWLLALAYIIALCAIDEVSETGEFKKWCVYIAQACVFIVFFGALGGLIAAVWYFI